MSNQPNNPLPPWPPPPPPQLRDRAFTWLHVVYIGAALWIVFVTVLLLSILGYVSTLSRIYG